MSVPEHVAEWSARPRLIAALARAKAAIFDSSHSSLARRTAGTAFLIRFASAAFVYLTQVLLARWMGSGEFGLYVYVWTWVLLVGDLIHMGLASAAQRFIPLYTRDKAFALLRGFLSGSRWLVLAFATGAALLLSCGVWATQGLMSADEKVALYLACATLPAYALSNMLDGIARSYNWIGVALLPPYMLRPLLLLVFMAAAHLFGVYADATVAMAAAVGSAWLAAAVQIVCLDRRLLREVPAGPKIYATKSWLATSLPILMVWGFYTLLTYTDVIVLSQFQPDAEVALYYAASKTLAMVAFVYFSVGAAVAHRFTEYHVAGDRERLAEFVTSSVRWTFWPSLAALVLVLALGRPVLMLFGPDFVQGYPLMFVLAAGLLARSSVGPAERLLNMLGEQRACATVYAIAFAINLITSIVLAPRLGAMGVAIATSSAVVSESLMLFVVAKWRLGLHVFVWRPRTPARLKVAAHV